MATLNSLTSLRQGTFTYHQPTTESQSKQQTFIHAAPDPLEQAKSTLIHPQLANLANKQLVQITANSGFKMVSAPEKKELFRTQTNGGQTQRGNHSAKLFDLLGEDTLNSRQNSQSQNSTDNHLPQDYPVDSVTVNSTRPDNSAGNHMDIFKGRFEEHTAPFSTGKSDAEEKAAGKTDTASNTKTPGFGRFEAHDKPQLSKLS